MFSTPKRMLSCLLITLQAKYSAPTVTLTIRMMDIGTCLQMVMDPSQTSDALLVVHNLISRFCNVPAGSAGLLRGQTDLIALRTAKRATP